MKFVMSILIVLHHFQQLTGIHYIRGINFWGGKYYWGRLVECFFIISGMMAAYGLSKLQSGEQKMLPYFKHKVLRLLPLPAVSILVYEVLTVIYYYRRPLFEWALPMEPDLKGTVISILGLQAWGIWMNPMINNPLWYVSILLLCQIILMFMGKFLKKPALFYGTCLLLVIPFMAYRLKHLGVELHFDHLFKGFYSFFFGVILAGLLKKRTTPNWLGFLGIGLVTLFAVLFELDVQVVVDYEILFSIYLVFPALLMFFMSEFVTKTVTGKVTDLLGAVSFDIYVWHIPLMFALYIRDGLNDALMPCAPLRHTKLFVLLVLAVAFASHYIGVGVQKLIGNDD